MEPDQVRLDVDGPIATVTLARPEKRNALGLDLMRSVIETFERVPSEAGVVIMAAEGKVFSAGHDLAEMIDRPDDYYAELFETCGRMMKAVHELRQPVIAKVQGVATAAGCQLVATCDLAIAADTAWFATPGVKIGLFCHTPMVPVSRAVGHKRAMQMLLTGEPIDAATAVDWGLINASVPAEELDDAVADMAQKILRYSKNTVALGKCTYYAQAEMPEDAAYEIAAPVMAANAAGVDAQEGMGAFLEKREPQWNDR
ncbi:putative enoyl-CoA hydratase echA8 [bacterium BMS3Abin02]|nr:putative enoyl-CoA hydratase echA8 [bacterium BMS3Abin02]GBE20860.1 putative enoyl-CoA hydratase echA8 [bacterium BMS3Bbin01]HDH27044.1 enoyl-CoA hydratase [Actinomycetota bacterium]